VKHEETTAGAEATFTTAKAPLPSAQTGGYNSLTPTSAIVAATVNPEGVPASYAFELGVYEGASTQYGVVFAGSPGTGTAPVSEELPLSGLQPGTTYAYRVSITSAHIPGHPQYGAAVTFTTPGLPAAIAPAPPLAQLPVPAIRFPRAVKPSPVPKRCAKARTRNRQGVCAGGKKRHKRGRQGRHKQRR
jgi:hypothetical protein